MNAPKSPLLDLDGAVAADGADAAVAAHYGSFNLEQRALVRKEAFVDLSHREVIRLSGPERLGWLHVLTTQFFEDLEPGRQTAGLFLDANGRIEHAFYGVDDGEAFWLHVGPGESAALLDWLQKMKFYTQVEIEDVTDEFAVTWRPAHAADDAFASAFEIVPRAKLVEYAQAAGEPAGLQAFDALRIEQGEPRLGVDTDDRTIPNEVGWIPSAVHLNKGCYRGQETVARVHTLGRPPRRLTMLHLDGSENRLPARGSEVRFGEKVVGFVGSAARHHELGPIALALVKRNVPVDAELSADGMVATQEVIVDPDVGLHARPKLG